MPGTGTTKHENGHFHIKAKDALGNSGISTDSKALSETDMIRGLKEALQIGTENAVGAVSKLDGFYKNPAVKIPLPAAVKKVEKLLRAGGYGPKVDAFEESMNRAAEKAAPQAKGAFSDAIKEMKFSDVKKVLNGKENEATLYFKEQTSDQLQKIFKPIAHQALSEVGATRNYQELAAKIGNLPFAGRLNLDLDQYVAEGALAGLFHTLAQEEKKIRQDPAARVTDLLKKIFK
ncbi:MAG: DUF4197 domain-containing protein [Desulfobacterales bacterium]|nr:DUF4197 domain-containing protein [Desulfobacterales bacterium]